MNESAYSAQIHNADSHNTFSQTAYEVNQELEDCKYNVEKKYSDLEEREGLGLDWKLFRKDSPTRRRILKD